MKKIVIPIGFPVHFLEYGNPQNYLIERRNKAITITLKELEKWKSLFSFEEGYQGIDEGCFQERLIDDFINKEIVFEADTEKDMVNKLLNVYPIRQGIGILNGDGTHISFNDVWGAITQLEDVIWQFSDGNHSIKEILSFVEQHGDIPIHVFYWSLYNLLCHRYIFLR